MAREDEKVTLREWYTKFTKKTNEHITHVQLWAADRWEWNWRTNTEEWMEEDSELWKTPEWVVAPVGTIWPYHETPKEILDYKFYDGFGSPESPCVLAWSKSYVLYISEYDGSQELRWIPRFPEKFSFPELEK